MKLRDEIEKLIQDYSGLGSSIIADRIITLIESRLPEVEEECATCEGKGWYYFLIEHDGMGHPTQMPCTCNHGKITRRMTLESAIEAAHREVDGTKAKKMKS